MKKHAILISYIFHKAKKMSLFNAKLINKNMYLNFGIYNMNS